MNPNQRPVLWPDDLLITKLNVPCPHFKVVNRGRLLEQIGPDTAKPITTIVAPAGYGKTTFLVNSIDNLRENGWTVVWVSLDSLDNELVRFWSYLLAGIQKETEIKLSSAQILRQAVSSQVQLGLSPLINSIAHWNQQLVVVLDDYHVITDDQIHQSLAYLVSHLPDNLHMIISSRKPIPLPLFRQKTERRLLEITADDLAFTLAEVNAFFSSSMDLELSNDLIQSLFQLTEGWIVALQLFAISLQSRKDFQSISKMMLSSRQQLSEYLLNDVLDQQPGPIREFLVNSSILSELSPEFCDTVLERNDSQQMLEAVKEANLFLVSIDQEQIWYRYHPLFAQALKDRLQNSKPELIKQMYERAFCWLKDRDYPYKAVEYAIAAEDYEKASDLIEECALQAIIRADTISLIRWINQISVEIKNKRPRLILYKVLASMLVGQLDIARIELAPLELYLQSQESRSLPAEELAVLEWKVNAIRTVMLSWSGNFVKEIPVIHKIIESAPFVEPYYLGFLSNSLAEGYGLAEDLEKCLNSFNRTKEFSRQNGLFDEYLNAACETARIYLLRGNINEARKIFASVLGEAAQTEANVNVIAFIRSGLMECDLIQNKLDSASKLADELSQFYTDEFSHGFPWIYQSITLLRIANYYFRVGQIEAMYPYIEWVNNRLISDRWSGCKMNDGIVHLQTELWLKEKHYLAAQNWLNDRIAENERFGICSTDERLMLARVFLEMDKPRSATPILSELEGYLAGKGLGYSLIRNLIYQAIAYAQLGVSTKGQDCLERAIELAEPQQIMLPFIRCGARIKNGLMVLVETGRLNANQEQFITEVLTSLSPESTKSREQSLAVVESTRMGLLKHILTDREVEIFKLLLDGTSEKDIAARQMISINTVKAHVRNIYKKLNIHNRREAHRWLAGT
jgi:LuxR family transcriptional regulator, maltose regulon positive regulatory protein